MAAWHGGLAAHGLALHFNMLGAIPAFAVELWDLSITFAFELVFVVFSYRTIAFAFHKASVNNP